MTINIHVDDSKLCFQLPEEEEKFLALLLTGPGRNGISDLGREFGECCGVEYRMTADGYVLHLQRWLEEVAGRLDLVGCKGRQTPLPARVLLLAGSSECDALSSTDHALFLTYVGVL